MAIYVPPKNKALYNQWLIGFLNKALHIDWGVGFGEGTTSRKFSCFEGVSLGFWENAQLGGSSQDGRIRG